MAAGAGGDIPSVLAGGINVVIAHDTGDGHRDKSPTAVACKFVFRQCAIVATAITAITFFDTFLGDRVAATRLLAGGKAGVGIDLIAIITGFDALVDKAITATRRHAGGQTGFFFVAVAIIAGLHTVVGKAITATVALAVVQAGVRVG